MEQIEKLRDVIINQAKYFLANAGEFYPFGAMIAKDGSITPLGVQLEDDHPHPQEVIEVLESAIIKKLKNREAQFVGIGTDVNYKPVGRIEKKSAIQIRILGDDKSVDYYLSYRTENGEFIFEELFTESGTLTF